MKIKITKPTLMFNEKSKSGIITIGCLGVGGYKGMVFDANGIIGALPASQYKVPTKVLEKK